jgi:arginine:ornithine antiporter/lysine permease
MRNRDLVVGAVATVYGLWLIYAAGLSYLLMCAMLFVPGILVYAFARREHGLPLFAGADGLIAAGLVACGVIAGWLIWNGTISPF